MANDKAKVGVLGSFYTYLLTALMFIGIVYTVYAIQI